MLLRFILAYNINKTYSLLLGLCCWLKQQIDSHHIPTESMFAAIVGFPSTQNRLVYCKNSLFR